MSDMYGSAVAHTMNGVDYGRQYLKLRESPRLAPLIWQSARQEVLQRNSRTDLHVPEGWQHTFIAPGGWQGTGQVGDVQYQNLQSRPGTRAAPCCWNTACTTHTD